MTFDEWFDSEHPVTELTNPSLRFAHREIGRVAWDAALRNTAQPVGREWTEEERAHAQEFVRSVVGRDYRNTAQVQVTDAEVEAAIEGYDYVEKYAPGTVGYMLARSHMRAALEAAARARGTGVEETENKICQPNVKS